MTTPPLPDWYPDPSGKPGLMYWDGQRWLTDIPDASSPAEQPPSTALQPQRQTALITAIVVAVVVALGIVGIACYVMLQHSHASRNPTAATSSEASVQPAPPSVPTAQPAPSSTPTSPTSQYLKTQWGTTCEVTAQQITCQVCIPGGALPARQTCTDPAPGRAINTAGTIFETSAVTIDSSSVIQQLSDGETYHAFGWTIVGSDGWARFINDTTGHGAALAAMNYYQL
jgi:hypothetical protein